MKNTDKDSKNNELKNESVTYDDIVKARESIRNDILDTRTRCSDKISQKCNATIYFKFENRQYTGAFKDRGALNCLLNLTAEQRKTGVVAMSAGNHAQGLSYHATRLGIPATIVMPSNTPYVKIRNTQNYGGKVELHGDLAQANTYALELAKEKGYAFVHPYDNKYVIAGQGTIGIEMLEAVPDLDCLVIPIGGGGLAGGVSVAAKAINPNIKIYGVQSEMYPSMAQVLAGEKPQVGGATIAEGIAVKYPGKITRQLIQENVDEVLTVSETHIERALVMILDYEKALVEGAGATGLACVMAYPDKFYGKKVGIILSGGNIDQRILSSVLMRDLVNIGRLGRLRIYMPDQPGTLSKVSDIIGENGGNVVEMTYQHIFTHATVKETSIEISIETNDSVQFIAIKEQLNNNGYRAIEILDK